ncbi:MAG: HDIG domain-containing protein [Dehalococcoidia bacterium]|nr:HDIG domain-containing protein [Dehalococcoidia bacterium]
MKTSSRIGAPGGLRTALFGVGLAGVLVLALFPLFPRVLELEAGDVASRTWQAPRSFSFESEVLTEKQREQAGQAVPDVLVFSDTVRTDQIAKLEKLISEVSAVRDSTELSRSQKVGALLETEGLFIPGYETVLVDMGPERWESVSREVRRVLEEVLSESVARGEESLIGEQLAAKFSESLSADDALVAELMVRPFIVPNLVVDVEKTEAARMAAEQAVVPVRVSYTKGQTIVRSGETIDSTAIEALREAGLLSPRLEWTSVAAATIVAVVAGGTVALYLHAFSPAHVGPRRLLLLLLVIGVATLGAKVYFPLFLPDHDRHFLAFALPLAAAPMLVAAVLETRLAVTVAAVLAALVTFVIIYLPDISTAVVSTPLDSLRSLAVFGFGGAAGALALHRGERLNRYLFAGLAVAIVSLLMLLAAWFLDLNREMWDLPWMGLTAAINGSVSAVLAAGAFVTLSSLFGITTRVQLMELAQLNQPLLRQLQDEAPGTFHHSIIVGNLGERAADLIGADSLLVRVGCYFHDVGKLRQPGYYIENQLTGSNPHDGLSSAGSAEIVIRHVEDGLELAREHRLPSQVHDFIAQHHGTGRAVYFYRKAMENEEELDSARFSYPGPKPQSKEVAIVMLADSVEAAIRASADRSPERIDALVDEVVAERLAEGQLDESDLTLREIKIVSESFKSTLRGVYHPRLEYPALPPKREKAARRLVFRSSRTDASSSGTHR